MNGDIAEVVPVLRYVWRRGLGGMGEVETFSVLGGGEGCALHRIGL